MTEKLSPAMLKTLQAMATKDDGSGSAYGLRVSLATMEALCARGLINRHSNGGWVFSPRTGKWEITQVGRDAIAKAKGGAQ